MFDETIENSKNEIINTLCELIKFPSVSDESGTSQYPFGEECNNILTLWGLKLKILMLIVVT